MEVSLFASAVRPKLWPALFKSLEGTSVEYEVVFAGNVPCDYLTYSAINTNTSGILLKEILTGNLKPAQCYEIARRACIGEVVVWIADDAEFPNNVIGKAYEYWKSHNNEKLILSIQTKESGYNNPKGSLFDMNEHRFFSWVPDSPLMAPLGMISRKFLDEIGGFDQRFVAGQYENFCVCMAYERGAKVEIFGGADCFIDIDHLAKSIAIGESTNEIDFLKRPFASSYHLDRAVLENSWTTFNEQDVFKILHSGERPLSLRKVSPIQIDEFIPYPIDIPLNYSLSNKGIWE